MPSLLYDFATVKQQNLICTADALEPMGNLDDVLFMGQEFNGLLQTIFIARAILKDAPIVILDETTASIDPENEHLIQQAISELTHGKTIITIAHRLATIRNADQILVVDDGRIAECGTHEELIAHDGLYQRFTAIRQQAEGWKL